MITYDDFQKVEIRSGTVLSVEPFPKAKKAAYKLTIDFGPLGIKKSSAQITHHYDPSKLVGKQIIAVTNFPPKQIADFISEVLVLGLSDEDKNIVLVGPDNKVHNGEKLH